MTSPFEPDFNDPEAPLFQYAPPGYKYQESLEPAPKKLKVIKLDELFKKSKKAKSPKRKSCQKQRPQPK